MNKRARNRLIGVTAIIILAVLAIFFMGGGGAYSRTVAEVLADETLVGERVKVSGEVAPGSWDKKSSPMKFDIHEEGVDDGPIIAVVYNGGVPSTFGDGVIAIVTGTLTADGVIESDDMITKCPSKYETAVGALSVDSLLKSTDDMVGTTLKITGYVAADGIHPSSDDEVRFTVMSSEDGGEEVGVFWGGAIPECMEPGVQVVLTGALGKDGNFVATDVALSEDEK